MRVFGILIMLLATLQLSAQNNMAEAYDINGILIFVEGSPKTQHRNLGSVKATTISTTLKESFLIKHVIKRAKKEYPDMQGLIFTGNLAFAEVITFEMSTKRSARSRSRKGEEETIDPARRLMEVDDDVEKLIFIQCKPKTPFTEVGEVQYKQEDPSNPTYKLDFLVGKNVKAAEAKGEEFDALYIVNGSNLHKAKMIKFKK